MQCTIMETDKLFTKMSIEEMKSALADREMDLLDFHTTYSILMGGWSSERDISLKTGQAVLNAMKELDLNSALFHIFYEVVFQKDNALTYT